MNDLFKFESDTGARHVVVSESPGDIPKLSRASSRRQVMLGVVAFALLLGAVASLILMQLGGTSSTGPTNTVKQTLPAALPNLPPPNLLRPLSPQQAQEVNAERPIEKQPAEPAAQFRLKADAVTRLRAIDCLTQAIYYEAASEGVDGGRAVAQVVLNRMRHPGYPNSVCGVVYQGSNLPTGCQFTFTCDGSLARVPVGYLWARSRQIAAEALAGRVYAPVGYATHYHADYVLPYWAQSVEKIAVIGRHIFYGLPGRTGSKAAFSQRYASKEPLPPPPPPPADLIDSGLTALEGSSPGTSAVAPPKVEEDKIEALSVAETADTQINSPLQADLARGQLILGEPTGSADKKPKTKQTSDCKGPAQTTVPRVGADNLKVGGSAQAC